MRQSRRAQVVTVRGTESRPLRRAGFARRMASLAYEAILLVPILFFSAYLFLSMTQSVQGPLKRPLFQSWLLCVLAVYFVYCWTRSGQTLAMKTWRIRLTQIDGTPIRMRQAIARFVTAMLGVMLLGFGFWWAFFDRDRQFLHDRLVGTRLYDHSIETTSPASPAD